MGVEKIKTELRGLYLVPPHGELIARGEKTAIAKSKDCGLQGEWILVSGKSAYGTMVLGEPEALSLKDFDAQFERHHVSEAERWRWWPNQERLWLYPVTEFSPYEGVKTVTVPPGVQTVMQDVTFDTQSRNSETEQEDEKGVRQLFGSPGGKSRLAKTIVALIPEHKAYVEPFAGGAAVFFAKEPSEKEVLSDRDPGIMGAFRMAQSISDADVEKLDGMEWRLGQFDKIKNSEPKDKLGKFHQWLYLRRMSRGKTGETIDTGELARSGPAHTSSGAGRLPQVRDRLKGVVLREADFKSVLKEFDAPGTFFYLDPPYPGYSQGYQGETWTEAEETELFDALKNLKGKFLLSLGAKSRERVPKGFEVRILKVGTVYRTGGDESVANQRKELLVANYPLPKRISRKGITATRFVLAHRAWEDETMSAEVWDLFIGDDDRNYWHVVLADSPITESEIAAQPTSGATITDTDGNTHSVFGLAVGDRLEVKPDSKFNPSETPCKFVVLDIGKAQTLLDEETQREYSFEGTNLKGNYRLQAEDEGRPEGFWLMGKSEQLEEVPEVPETEEATMPWTVADPPNPAKNWTEAERKKCVEAANAVLREEGTEQDAIFACIRAAGKTEHPGGEDAKENTMQEVTVLIDGEQIEVEQGDVKAKWSASYISSLPDTAFLLIESGGEKKDGITRPLSLRHLPVCGKDGEVDLPHTRNAIARAPQLKDKDGKSFLQATIEKAQDKARKLLAEAQKARGEGQGTEEARLADGGANYCICPTCKRLIEHDRGQPCNELKCEECDVMLQGATDAEIEAAGVQAEQAEVAAPAAGVDSAIKTGKRVRGDRITALARLKKELEEFLSAFKEFIGWATYEDEDTDTKEDDGLGLSEWLGSDGKKALTEHGSAAFAFKALDGSTWWMQWTTNAFRDREQEIFTTKSIADYVKRHRDEEIKGEFWYRHIPGTKFGDVRWQAMEGRFLVQAGPFDDTPIGTAFKTFFEQYPTGHPEVAPGGWGTSHGYAYDQRDREDGVYEWFEIRESTVLPLRAASNPWNPMPQILEVKQMNEQEKKDLEAIGGGDLVKAVLNAGQAKTKELEDAGIAYKETSTEPPVPEEDKKAGNMAKLIGKVEEIAGGMEGETGEALKAVCAEMKAAYEDIESEPEADEKEAEPKPEPKPEPEATKEAPLTRAEVSAGMQALLGAVREEIKATSETTVQTLMDQLKPIIEELQKPTPTPTPEPEPEPEPEAVKESLTPAASLADLFASVRASKEARISPNSELAKKGPKETAPTAPSVTGVSLVDHFIASTDQSVRQ